MSPPIQKLLDDVRWEVVPPTEDDGKFTNLPHVTHKGVLKLGDYSLPVYQLSDGQRVIDHESIEELFKNPPL